MRLRSKSQFAGLVDLRDPVAFYYVALGVDAACSCSDLPDRQFPLRHAAARREVQRGALAGHRLLAYPIAGRFIIAGAMCGRGRRPVANHTSYITPG